MMQTAGLWSPCCSSRQNSCSSSLPSCRCFKPRSDRWKPHWRTTLPNWLRSKLPGQNKVGSTLLALGLAGSLCICQAPLCGDHAPLFNDAKKHEWVGERYIYIVMDEYMFLNKHTNTPTVVCWGWGVGGGGVEKKRTMKQRKKKNMLTSWCAFQFHILVWLSVLYCHTMILFPDQASGETKMYDAFLNCT